MRKSKRPTRNGNLTLEPPPAEVARRLRRIYDRPHGPRPRGLVGGLIRTVLSQNTTSANAEAAYRRLRERFPEWQQVAAAPLRSIEAAIRPAGLAKQRARAIRGVIRRLMDIDPSLQLDELREMPTRRLIEFLESLPGVGPKTAACVALFELGRPVFPVDTHIARIARRLGWAGHHMTPEQIQAALEPAIPPRLRHELHINLIAHGRAVCRARRPQCEGCCLADLCPSAGAVQ